MKYKTVRAALRSAGVKVATCPVHKGEKKPCAACETIFRKAEGQRNRQLREAAASV